MESKWCTWCDLGCNQFSQADDDRKDYTLWTLDLIRSKKDLINGNDQSVKDATEKKGVVSEIIFDAIQVSNFIFPVLHAEIGIGNNLLEYFFKLVDYRVENVTAEEEEKRDEYRNQNDVLIGQQEVLRGWILDNGHTLGKKREDRTELRLMKGQKYDDGKCVRFAEERNVIQQ